MADLLRAGPQGLILPGRKPSRMRLPRGITAYWPLDAANCEFSAAGGQVRPLDLVGNNYGVNAKSMGAAGRPPFDQDGIGFNFDGTTNTYIVLNSDPLAATAGTATALTCSIWAYHRSFISDGTAGNGPRIYVFGNELHCLVDDGTTYPAGSVAVELNAAVTGSHTTDNLLKLNAWNHIAFTVVSRSPTAIYINGVAATLAALNGGFSSSANLGNIGCRDAALRIMNGKLAHAMVCCGTVLTAAEIADLYYSTFIPDEVMPALLLPVAGGSFIPAWAMNSNLPVIGTGTY